MMPATSGAGNAQNGYMLPANAGFEAAEIPGLRKAAILIMAVGDELAKTLFQSLN